MTDEIEEVETPLPGEVVHGDLPVEEPPKRPIDYRFHDRLVTTRVIADTGEVDVDGNSILKHIEIVDEDATRALQAAAQERREQRQERKGSEHVCIGGFEWEEPTNRQQRRALARRVVCNHKPNTGPNRSMRRKFSKFFRKVNIAHVAPKPA